MAKMKGLRHLGVTLHIHPSMAFNTGFVLLPSGQKKIIEWAVSEALIEDLIRDKGSLQQIHGLESFAINFNIKFNTWKRGHRPKTGEQDRLPAVA